MKGVIFAPTLAAARRAARGDAGYLLASPGRDRALRRALAESLPVRFVAPKSDARFWELVRRRYRLPAPPPLLREAIGGIARHAEPAEEPSSRRRPARGSAAALWIEGRLSDSRARRLRESSGAARIWVIEDFRRLALTNRVRDRLEAAGIRISALRTLKASVLRSRG